MSNTMVNFLVLDMRLQLRNGIYYAYAFVLAFYISVLVFAAEYIPSWALALFIYTDPSVLGFFFLGALMLLEKAEGSRTALAITPLSVHIYFWSKTITLTGVALVAAIILALVAKANVNWPLYVSAIVLTSVSFIGIGFPIALKFKTVTGYLLGAAGILTPLTLPIFFALFDPMGYWAMLIPTAAQFRLFLVSLGTFQASGLELFIMLLVSALSAVALVIFATETLKKEFGSQ